MSFETVLAAMTADDLEEVMAIELGSFTAPWTRGMFIEELHLSQAVNLVARRAGRLAGYLNFWIVVDEIHLLHIAVHPSLRRKGIGARLMEGMMEHARLCGATHATLEVREFNHGAIAFYGGFSFVIKGIRPRYYDDTGEDALVMWADVPAKNDHERRHHASDGDRHR